MADRVATSRAADADGEHDWGLRDFQSIATDRCGMAHPIWTDDNGVGETVTATQSGGPSLFPTARC